MRSRSCIKTRLVAACKRLYLILIVCSIYGRRIYARARDNFFSHFWLTCIASSFRMRRNSRRDRSLSFSVSFLPCSTSGGIGVRFLPPRRTCRGDTFAFLVCESFSPRCFDWPRFFLLALAFCSSSQMLAGADNPPPPPTYAAPRG